MLGQANPKKREYDEGDLVEGHSSKRPTIPWSKPQSLPPTKRYCTKSS